MHNTILHFVMLVFILTGNADNSKNTFLGNEDDINHIYFHKYQSELLIFEMSELKKISIPDFSEISHAKINFPVEFNFHDYTTVEIKDSIFFVHKEGGLVYLLFNNTISRIDFSFNHRMQTSSAIFTYNGKIYRFGGYGFWSARNFFTIYNFTTNEWDAVEAKNNGILPPGLANMQVKLMGDTAFIFGGYRINPYTFSPDYETDNETIWSFNFKEKTWNKLGITNFKFPAWLNSVFDFEGYFLYKPIDGNLFQLDFAKNKILEYPYHQGFRFDPFLNGFYSNNTFYFFYTNQDKMHVRSYQINEVLEECISIQKIYTKHKAWKYFLYGILMLISTLSLGLAYIRWKNYRKLYHKIHLNGDTLTFRGEKLNIDKNASKIIQTLLTREEPVLSTDLINLVELKQNNHNQNTRLKNLLIDELNLHIRILLHLKNDVIYTSKYDQDKRNHEYQIMKKYFHLSKK